MIGAGPVASVCLSIDFLLLLLLRHRARPCLDMSRPWPLWSGCCLCVSVNIRGGASIRRRQGHRTNAQTNPDQIWLGKWFAPSVTIYTTIYFVLFTFMKLNSNLNRHSRRELPIELGSLSGECRLWLLSHPQCCVVCASASLHHSHQPRPPPPLEMGSPAPLSQSERRSRSRPPIRAPPDLLLCIWVEWLWPAPVAALLTARL